MDLLSIMQASLVPAVILSGAGIIGLNLQNRYGRVIDRIRAFHYEIMEKRKKHVEMQIDILIRRGRLLRNAMFSILMCILLAVFTAILMLFNLIFKMPSSAILIAFTFSLLFLFIAILFAVAEIFISYDAVLKEDEAIRG